MTGARAARLSGSRYPWWLEPAAAAGAALVRLLGPTWRVDKSGLAAFEAAISQGRRCIFAVWHARVLPLAWTHRSRGIVVLVSRHRDGQLIARIIERLGFATSRGSSTRLSYMRRVRCPQRRVRRICSKSASEPETQPG